MMRHEAPWRQSPRENTAAELRLKHIHTAAMLMVRLLVLMMISVAVLPAEAWGATTNKADPTSGTRKLTFEADDVTNRWQFDGSQNNYTRFRWVPDKETGNLAYCINPGVTHGPGEGTQTYPARLLAPSDFKNEELYLHCLAALYYAPGGPGYKTDDGNGIGRTFFPDQDYKGKSFSFRDRFASSHVYMGYCYNDANWDKAFGGAADASLHQPAPAYKAWFLEHIVPKDIGGTGAKSFGDLARKHLNDEDMVENGGYTLDAWKESVYLIMTGNADDGFAKQDMLTYLSAPTAPLTLQKVSGSSNITKDNPAYSLAGAEYAVYADKATKNEIATLVTNAQGEASTGNLVVGTYYVKETKPSPCYLIDKTVHAVKVRKDGGSLISKEPPRHLPLTTLLGKADARTKSASPEGMCSLADAEFTVRYYPGSYKVAADLPNSPLATWVVTTDADGVARKPIDVPLGTYTFQETRAPKGYRSDPTVYIGHVIADDSTAFGARLRPANYSVTDVKTAPNFPDYLPVAQDEPITCGFKVEKNDADLQAPSAQGDASLVGAVFSVTNESSNPVMVNGKSYAQGEECLTVTAERTQDGIVAQCDGDVLPFGDYLITEKSPPEGYLPNSEWSVHIVADENLAQGYIWSFPEYPCHDPVIRGGIRVAKFDHELQDGMPLGSATLEGAEISVYLDSEQPVVVSGTRYEKGDCVFKMMTESDGTCSTGDHDLPYGTYTLRETMEPTGYLRNDSWKQQVSIRDDGAIVACNPVDDQVKRGDIQFTKVREDDMERMGRTAFLITSKTTGESHVVVSDENGSVDTSASWNPHTRNTNGNDSAIKPSSDSSPSDSTESPNTTDDDEGENAEEGNAIVEPADPTTDDKGDSDANTSDADADSQGNEGEGSDEYSESGGNDERDPETGSDLDARADSEGEYTADSGMPDESLPAIEPDMVAKAIADALDADSASADDIEEFRKACANAKPNEDIPFTITVNSPDESEKRTCIMTLQEDGSIVVRDAVTDDEVVTIELSGTAVTTQAASSSTADEHDADNGDSQHTQAHETDDEKLDLDSGIWFSGRTDRHTEPDDALGALPYDTYSVQELRGAANEGMSLVHFDVKVTRDATNLDMGTVDDSYISLNTVLNAPDGSHVASPTGTVKLVDEVEYSGLTPSKTYEMRGYLVNKENGERYGETSISPFTPTRASGSVDVSFEVEGEGAAGMTLVAYQELFEGDELVAEHKDLDDLDETVSFPSAETPSDQPPAEDPGKQPEAEPDNPGEKPGQTTADPKPITPKETPRPVSPEKPASAQPSKSLLAKTGDLIGPYLWLFAPLILGLGGSGGYGLWRRRAFAYRPW